MPEKMNVYTQVAQELGQELARLRGESEKSAGKVVPFGMMRVSAEAEARALLEMRPEEVKVYMERNGLQRTLEVARRGLKLRKGDNGNT